MKLTVTKEFTWDCAHMLSGHQGLCRNVHGHTYKMHVEVAHFGTRQTHSNSEPDKEGMVVDFKELKQIVTDKIVSKFDHAFIAWRNGDETEKAVVNVLEMLKLKRYYMDDRPTAENMAKHFAAVLKREFKDSSIAIISVTVWETPTSFAKFTL